MKKVLYILRHAEARAPASGQEDHDRPLTPGGAEDAAVMGKYMKSAGIRPDLVLCSTAARCRQTLDIILPSPLEGEGQGGGQPHPLSPSLKGRGNIEYTDRLYLASANELVALLKDTPESVHSLMLVGHNPGLHELCMKLAKDGPATFPTGALATIAFDGAWRDIGRVNTTLTGFITPKTV